MQITDAPYAAGTPEHNEWVRNVLIPHQQVEVQLVDMGFGRQNRPGSAESQGRKVIQGGPFDSFDEDGNPIYGGTLAEYMQQMQDRLLAAVQPGFSTLRQSLVDSVNNFKVFFEEFQGMAAYGVVIPDKGQLDLGIITVEPEDIVAKALDPLEPVRNPEPKPLWADAIVSGVADVQAKLERLNGLSRGNGPPARPNRPG